ncbi:hypothetical protein K440DRAFT_426047 [Wilcoxina mikolae CBS 423.85]|nr:hypothetical protein K440DRAFT_426047 [Wilcoxina mikolae CBS 423.85]
MGVPHSGCNAGVLWAARLLSFLYLPFGSRSDLLNIAGASRQSGSGMHYLNRDFVETYHRDKTDLICFYETEAEYFCGVYLGPVVSQESASICGYAAKPLFTDHRRMSKLHQRDQNYATVLNHVKQLVKPKTDNKDEVDLQRLKSFLDQHLISPKDEAETPQQRLKSFVDGLFLGPSRRLSNVINVPKQVPAVDGLNATRQIAHSPAAPERHFSIASERPGGFMSPCSHPAPRSPVKAQFSSVTQQQYHASPPPEITPPPSTTIDLVAGFQPESQSLREPREDFDNWSYPLGLPNPKHDRPLTTIVSGYQSPPDSPPDSPITREVAPASPPSTDLCGPDPEPSHSLDINVTQVAARRSIALNTTRKARPPTMLRIALPENQDSQFFSHRQSMQMLDFRLDSLASPRLVRTMTRSRSD